MNATMQPGFLAVLAGEPSEAEIEERYLALARLLLNMDQHDHQAA